MVGVHTGSFHLALGNRSDSLLCAFIALKTDYTKTDVYWECVGVLFTYRMIQHEKSNIQQAHCHLALDI